MYPDLVNDFPDLRLKAHVKHSVRLVQHEVSAATEVCFSCLEEVDEPSWSGNADLHTYKQILIMRTHFSRRIFKIY